MSLYIQVNGSYFNLKNLKRTWKGDKKEKKIYSKLCDLKKKIKTFSSKIKLKQIIKNPKNPQNPKNPMLNSVKRTDRIVYYKPPKEEEEMGGDIQQILSLILVFAGIMLKVKQKFWIIFHFL